MTKIKLIIFDAYGVTLKGGYPKTMRALAKRFHKNWKELYDVFYTKYFNLATENKISETDAWKLPIRELGFPITWQEAYKVHLGGMALNKQTVNLIKSIRRKYKVILLSKNTKSQFGKVSKRFKLSKIFDELINTQDINLPKSSPKTYQYLIKRFNVRPEEIIYIDDQKNNLIEAKKMGIKTILYKNVQQMKNDLGQNVR